KGGALLFRNYESLLPQCLKRVYGAAVLCDFAFLDTVYVHAGKGQAPVRRLDAKPFALMAALHDELGYDVIPVAKLPRYPHRIVRVSVLGGRYVPYHSLHADGCLMFAQAQAESVGDEIRHTADIVFRHHGLIETPDKFTRCHALTSPSPGISYHTALFIS